MKGKENKLGLDGSTVAGFATIAVLMLLLQ
jgi:hypothetical protein